VGAAIMFGLYAPAQAQDLEKASGTPILFVRGGSGTGGFLEGGSDDQLSSIEDYSTANGNHGWGRLADILVDEGYVLEEVREEPVVEGVPTPIDFANMDLTPYAAIVLASNNAAYGTAAVDAIENYIRSGGGVLFISDANFGQDWPDAPTSDQHFLDRFGLIMNQDRGTYAITEDEFVMPAHPILEEVSGFDGEGVSPITISDTPPADVVVNILARAEGQVRRNDTSSGRGTSSPATPQDAALVALEVGEGHVVGHFDRNTFFNKHGAGTDITRFDNARYAKNLFAWLTQGGPLPVEWTYVRATTQGRDVTIKWETASETQNAGFEVQQRQVDGAFDSVGYVEGAGNTLQRQTYALTVRGVTPGQHVFRMKQIDRDGTYQYSEAIEVWVAGDSPFELGAPTPNPVRRAAQFTLHVNRTQHVDIELIDMLGRRHAYVHRGTVQAGRQHTFRVSSTALPAGVYFIWARGEVATAMESFVVVR